MGPPRAASPRGRSGARAARRALARARARALALLAGGRRSEAAEAVCAAQGGACTAEGGGTEVARGCVFDGPEDIFDWVRSRGGLVDRRLFIHEGRIGRGVFTREAIGKGETIVSVPYELMILERDHPCDTVRAFSEELRRGRCSPYWPYLKFVRDIDIDIPDAWSLEELALLDGLPPGVWRGHTSRLSDQCGELELSDVFVARATVLHVSRSGPLGMQPIFDAFNHGFNSTHHDLRIRDMRRTAGNAHMFVTMRDIAAGEELFNTFRPGAGLGRDLVHKIAGRGSHVDGAPEFFRDYGFIEKPPVLWWFNTSMLVEAGAGQRTAGKQLRWVVEDDAGTVYWPDAHTMDWGEFATEARKVLRALDERRWAFDDAGVRCAGYILGRQQPSDEAPPCGIATPSDRRVLLALLYRAAFEDAVRAALAAAEAAAAAG